MAVQEPHGLRRIRANPFPGLTELWTRHTSVCSTVAVITGAALNVLLDPVFMFSWGFGMGVEGASLATTISQCVTFVILVWFYLSGRSIIAVKPRYFKLSGRFLWEVSAIGIPTAVIQICLAVATSLTNIAAKPLPDSDLIIAAYGVVQRLILIGCYMVMGFMQGYQPVASYAFGARDEERFHSAVRFALKGALLLTVLVALYPAFGLCYMMTITFQTIGGARMGLFLPVIRQGLFYVPFILLLPKLLGLTGIYLSQPAADVLTIGVCLALIKPMKQMASRNMLRGADNEA